MQVILSRAKRDSYPSELGTSRYDRDLQWMGQRGFFHLQL
jgi:hypothetical protein